MGGANQWRKESVTIIESQEPMDEENEGDVESDGIDKDDKDDNKEDKIKVSDSTHGKVLRRLSGSVESATEGQFLCVPHSSITASSSAETLTDNTITAPSTPTNLGIRSVVFGTNNNQGYPQHPPPNLLHLT